MKKRAAEHDEFADSPGQRARVVLKFPGEYWRALDRERGLPDRIRRGAYRGRAISRR